MQRVLLAAVVVDGVARVRAALATSHHVVLLREREDENDDEKRKRHDRGRMEVSLDLRDILRFVVGAFRETTDAARSARVGGTPSIASRARASVGSSAASASGEAPSLLAASPRDRRAGLGRGNRATRLVSASLRFGIGRTCARMSTSLPLPSSPHWEPSTAHTWPSLFHSALLAFVVADGSATALQTVGRAARTARCGLCAFPENTAACARMGATAAMTLIVQTGRMSWVRACRTSAAAKRERSTHRQPSCGGRRADRACFIRRRCVATSQRRSRRKNLPSDCRSIALVDPGFSVYGDC